MVWQRVQPSHRFPKSVLRKSKTTLGGNRESRDLEEVRYLIPKKNHHYQKGPQGMNLQTLCQSTTGMEMGEEIKHKGC